MTDFDEEALGQAYERGLAAEKRGEFHEAAEAYRACLEIDPTDHVGARIRIAGFGGAATPASAGDAYVETLFDQHAESFEDILVRQLRYGVPEQLAERLRQACPRFERVLDLGCGTGLAGEHLTDIASHLTGVDLSGEMVRVAGEKQTYDRLFVAEAVTFLQHHDDTEPYDLIVATDVMPYVGDLDPIVRAARGRLAPDGCFGFSTETMNEDELRGRPFAVGRAQRFHHGEQYVRQILSAHDFAIDVFEPITVRMQDGKPAPGHLVIAHAF